MTAALDAPRPADREAALYTLAGAARGLPDRVLAHGPPAAGGEPEAAATRAQLGAVRRLLGDRSPKVRAAAAVALAVAGDDAGPIDARRAREKDALVCTVLDVASAVVRGDRALLPGVPVDALVERLFDRERDWMAWGSGFRASLAARALIRLGPEARALGLERLLATLSDPPELSERLVRAGHAALLALPPDRPTPPAPDREPPDPDLLDPAVRRALAAIAAVDAVGPQGVWTMELHEAIRCAGLPESTRGLRQYLGLVPPAGMEVRVAVRGARVPLFLACKRVALGTWPLDELVAAVAAHPDPTERAEICCTFNPWQYEIVQTRRVPWTDGPGLGLGPGLLPAESRATSTDGELSSRIAGESGSRSDRRPGTPPSLGPGLLPAESRATSTDGELSSRIAGESGSRSDRRPGPAPDGSGWDAVPLAAGASPDLAEVLLRRVRAAAQAIGAGRTGGVATTALVALARLEVPLGPELDPLIARAVRGVMRAWLPGPREVLASLPLARREAVVLGLPAAPPTALDPRGSGYAWDLADLAPTAAVAAHLRQGLAGSTDRPASPAAAAFVTAVLARVESPGDAAP